MAHALCLGTLHWTWIPILTLIYVLARFYGRNSTLPGPPKLPFIGNLHQIPRTGTHLKFTQWAKTYGGMFALKLGGKTAIVISSRRMVKELLEKKGAIYSDRPQSYVGNDLITKGNHLLVMRYGDLWRDFRRRIHQHFSERACERDHLDLQNAEAIHMLRDFCLAQEGHQDHLKRFSNSIASAIIFGFRSETIDDPFVQKLYRIMVKWSAVMETGATPPVDVYPILKLVPERFLGNWVSRARDVGQEMEELYSALLDTVLLRRSRGHNAGSFLDKLLDQQGKSPLERSQLYFLGGVLLEGGSDTSAAILMAFVQAMVHYPAIQRKAQKEIDDSIGEDRTPTWADFSKLPYVNMLIKESQRWRPVTPLSFPHAAFKDDILDGHKIPKGSTLILNVWGLHHDEEAYYKPESFIPERYENHHMLAPEYASLPDYTKRDHYGYGAGRRICPGIHLAERNLFLAISKLLWAFSFSASVDGDGNTNLCDTDPITGYSEGFLHCAKPFKCDIRARSPARRDTIFREFELANQAVFSRYH